ncbi:MAG TPA: 2TM domain-containing protein [Spirochaetia bacterium]|nr:2TM domain-containing protein [Spirochaetia bacterium]
MADANEKYKLARKIAERKVGFIRHAAIYLLVIAGLAIINNVTYTGYQWWLWPALGWGIGVVSHFLSAFLYQSGALVDRVAKRELEKMDESNKS